MGIGAARGLYGSRSEQGRKRIALSAPSPSPASRRPRRGADSRAGASAEAGGVPGPALDPDPTAIGPPAVGPPVIGPTAIGPTTIGSTTIGPAGAAPAPPAASARAEPVPAGASPVAGGSRHPLVDEAAVLLEGGRGGNGAVSFRREKFVPRGGPDGGNGGRGGDVVLAADAGRHTLAAYRFRPSYRGGAGGHGSGNNRQGRAGADLILRVPAGTAVFDRESGVLLGDLAAAGDRLTAAPGGRGGRGNAVFRTPTNQAPRRSEPGAPGLRREVRLELRLLADVGLLGFPNAGKSSFIARVSAARPRIADYPFTTLRPNLGMVRLDDDTEFVIADLPGVLPGASRGAGMGNRFLKHLSRTALLVYFVDASEASNRRPEEDLAVLREEVLRFGAGLPEKPALVAGNKTDLVDDGARLERLHRAAASLDLPFFALSAATGNGCRRLTAALGARLAAGPEEEDDAVAVAGGRPTAP